ncbi:hypothetical protein [Brevundimonas denitrificans]|uniref:hypothetical protein n=1 Tax=Brevundimonas denitrificans TaxID=1443434 RepID=UPI00223A70E1|nr:hypothetical protein [Brevundimonas denitrificans]
MSGDRQVYIDDSPGETRGVIESERGFEHILIQREADVPPGASAPCPSAGSRGWSRD